MGKIKYFTGLSLFLFACSLMLYSHAVADALDEGDLIRIKLERRDIKPYGNGWLFDFEKDFVEKALEKYKVKLPEPLLETARVGIGPSWLLFSIMQKIPGKSAVRLILDRNGNFDLTDEDPLEIASGWEKAQIHKMRRSFPGPDPRHEWLPYCFFYIERTDESGKVQEDFFIAAGYAYFGGFRLSGRDFSVQVDDHLMKTPFKIGDLAGVSIQIETKDGANKNSYKPFELIPIGNVLYELSDIAADGSWIELKKSSLRPAVLGRMAPDMPMVDTLGKAFKISDYRGKALLLNFWTTWCKPCLAKFPEIKKMIKAFENQPFAVVGVNFDNEKWADEAKKLIEEYQLPWRQVVVQKGWTHPVYQVYGRLPENPMSFPVYVLMDRRGLVCYATNDYLKMERCLAAHFSDKERERTALFIPLAVQWEQKPHPFQAVDFSEGKVTSFLKANTVKMPAELIGKVRIGLMPNGTIVVAQPGPTPDKILLTIDVDRDLDLTAEKSKEIPIVSALGEDVPDAVEMQLKIRYASGGWRIGSFRFFARPTTGGNADAFPEIFYIGQLGLYKGAFRAGRNEYALEVIDPTGDWIITPEDAGRTQILKLKIKKGGDWTVVHQGIRHIPIAGFRYSLRQVWEDGQLVILEKEQ